MKEFGLGPAEWRALGRFEKRCLYYHRVMEGWYMRRSQEEAKREREKEQNRQKFLSTLPRQMPRRGR